MIPNLNVVNSQQPGLFSGFSRLCLALFVFTQFSACGQERRIVPAEETIWKTTQLRPLGYTIQVGAFSRLHNALRLTHTLETRGLEPYYFQHPSGLYKVRFGNFDTRRAAETRARRMMISGDITDYYIVSPQEYSLARSGTQGYAHLRDEIVETAAGFLGLPYQWGGIRAAEGFDCSGLSMTVYRLNGLDLPRTSREQFQAGNPVSLTRLSRGDLVFFCPAPSKRVSHVGIYTGNGRFIHAPGQGKTVRSSSLHSGYYQNIVSGARSYIQ